MLPRLIGITGLAGSGKDTLADALVYDRGAEKYNFALPIKHALNAMFGWTMEQWDDRIWKETKIAWLGKSPRQCAQTLGTEWGRDLVHPDLWMLIAEDRYLKYRQDHSGGPFIIPDVRFENEVDMIHRNGGIVVKISRLGVNAVSAHVSEKGIEEVDYILANHGTVRQFLELSFGVLDNWSSYG